MEKSEINLVILSPSAEVNKLTFPSIPTTTTVDELRERISATAVTHPAPGRQRLIYRGHALIDTKRTLKDVFTQEVIDGSETLSLHLVLPPENAVQPGSSSISSHVVNNGLRSRTPQQSQGSTGTYGSPQTQPSQGSGIPAMHGPTGQSNVTPRQNTAQADQAHHVRAQGGLANGQIPLQLQQAFTQFQAINQQLAAQLAAVGANPALQPVGPIPTRAQASQQLPFAQPSIQQPFMQQQQMRTVAGQTGSGYPQEYIQTSRAGSPAAQGNIRSPAHSPTPGNTNTIVRENHGPNGERWQMVIQSGQLNIPHNNTVTNHLAPSGSLFVPGLPRHASPVPQGMNSPQSPMPSASLMHLQSNLSAIETAMAGGNPLPEAVFEQAREMLRGMPDLSEEGRSALSTRLNSLADRANHLRETLNNYLSRTAQERAAAQRTTQGVLPSEVYVLASPSGPHALLVSPTGFYSAPWQPSILGSVSPYPSIHHHSFNVPTQNQTTGLPDSTREQPPYQPVVQAQQPAPQQVNGDQMEQVRQQLQQHRQQNQQQQVNQARDLLRILLPLGGHLWLLIRLFGFVYFFTAGAGWRRTILLGLVASLVFIAQTGIFRPLVQAIWDPIRRHAEGLVPLAGNERPGRNVPQAGEQENPASVQPITRGPTPQEAAERLLQERERRDVNFVRQTIRRAERAIALFVASLVPGVGERHIAAREAAEAARLAEATAREEQIGREEAETRQRQEESTSGDIGVEEHANAVGEGGQSTAATGGEQSAPPPLIEV